MGKNGGNWLRLAGWKIFLVCGLAGLLAWPASVTTFAQPAPYQVLLINSYHSGLTWADEGIQGVRSALPAGAEIYIEYLDTKRINTREYMDLMAQLLTEKYQGKQFDVVIALDDDAFNFALTYGENLFSQTPVVFSGVNYFDPQLLKDHPFVTGVVDQIEFEANLDLATSLYPNAAAIVVITDRTSNGIINRHVLEMLAASGKYSPEFIFLDDGSGLSLNEMLDKLRGVPQGSIIYFSDFYQDRSGPVLEPELVMPRVSEVAPGPVFVHRAMYLGYGALGGKVASGVSQGTLAGQMAARILAGESVQRIPVQYEGANYYAFDVLQLDRWKISRKDLPADSTYINERITFYRQYRDWLWGIALFIVLQTAIIGGLLLNISTRRRAQAALRRSEERLNWVLAGIRDAYWDWNIANGGFFVSPLLQDMLGYPIEFHTASSYPWEFLVPPAERTLVREMIDNHLTGKTDQFRYESRVTTAKGEERWILTRGRVVERDGAGKPLRAAGTMSDITGRKRSELAMQSILKGTSGQWGESFFQSLMLELTATLNMRYGLVGVVAPGKPGTISTLAYCENGEVRENIDYKLKGSPSGTVFNSELHVYPDNLQALFPQDIGLVEMEAVSYIGVPLSSRSGKPLGVMALLDDHPIRNDQIAHWLVSAFANRAAGEIERLQSERALRESEQRWQFALEGSGDGVWDWDLITGSASYSRRFKELLGFSDAEMPNLLSEWTARVHPDDLTRVMDAHERHWRGGTESMVVEYRVRCKDGNYRWMMARGKVIEFEPNGKPRRMVGTNQDITERKNTERALTESFVRYQTLFTRMSEGCALSELVYDSKKNPVNYRTLDVNPAFERILGLSREQVVGELADKAFGVSPPPFLKEFCRVAMTGEPVNLDVQFSGIDKHISLSVFSPKPDQFAVVFSDETDRYKANDLLDQERILLRTVIDNLPDSVYAKNLDLRKTLVNTAEMRLMGLSTEEEAIGKDDYAVYPTERADQFRRHDLEVIKSGEPILNLEELVEFANGETRWLLTSKLPLRDNEGKVVGLVGIGRDITERKRSDEEILRLNADLERRVNERTAELQEANKELEAFSYSVSHDLRAPLRSLDGFSHALLEDYNELLNDTGKDYLRRIRASSQRMSDLIDSLLKLSRITRAELRRVPVNLSEIAHSVAADLHDRQPEREVEWKFEEGIIVEADPGLMRSAISNLLENAWKFTSKHPVAKVELGRKDLSGEEVIFVRDDGAGFDMTYSQKLFGAFQRMHTAQEFEGTGIGLAVVNRIIRRHGGRVWIESAVEGGTTVYFTLA